MIDLALTARLPLARLTRTPRAWIPVLAWGGLAIVSALVLHRGAGVDAMQAIFGPLALPLLSFTVVGAVLGGDGLARASRPFVAFGASPLEMALATVGVAILSDALVASFLGAAVAALSHGGGELPLGRDALTTAWVAGLGGAAYGSLFCFGASFGKRGGGRAVALAVDWILGAGSSAVGLVTPRAHVRSLLGGDPVMGLSGHASAIALAALAVSFAALAAWRARSA